MNTSYLDQRGLLGTVALLTQRSVQGCEAWYIGYAKGRGELALQVAPCDVSKVGDGRMLVA
jgi:hypothetical protein